MKRHLARLSTALCVWLAAFASPDDGRAAAGDLDPTFNPNANSSVYSAVTQTDGRIVVGGGFTSIAGTTRNYLARLNTDGSLDTTFNPNANSGVNALAVQADGKIIVGGFFTSFQPNGAASATTRNYLARLNTDGSLDTTFNPNANSQVYGMVVQADGRIVIGGGFSTLQPNGAASATTRRGIARLNTDGSLDTTYDPNTVNSLVVSLAVQTDGKIVIGGFFQMLQPNGAASATTRNYVARINTDGSLDTGFNPNANNGVVCVAVQGDGKVLVGGNFTTLQPNGAASATTRDYVARLNTDGSLDTTFNPNANSGVNGLAVQTDGKIVVAGGFSTIAGTARKNIARLNADGSVDAGFDPEANNVVQGTAGQIDGKIILTGGFTSLQPNGAASATTRYYLARLANDPVLQKVVATGTATSATVQLLRSGALPEAQAVTFETYNNATSAWINLTSATRITGGWQVSGFNVNSSDLIRARVRVSGGEFDGSSGLEEVIASFPTPDIAVEEPTGTALASGFSTVDFGEQPTGAGVSNSLTFTVRNSGAGTLTLGGDAFDGTNAADFSINTAGTSVNVANGGSTTFKVNFAPTGTASAYRTATLHLASNANGTNSPFNVLLTGLGLSTTSSTGNDGLNDQAKYNLAALGFNWQVSQPALVNTLFNGANSAGLFTAAQVQALYVGAPLIQRDATTGKFTLTIAVEQSADLHTYTPLSLATGTAAIDGAGALEFTFGSASGAAFYRLQSQ